MYHNNLGMPRIAIFGDNLLITPWIRAIVRLADAFIVKRNLSSGDACRDKTPLKLLHPY